MAELAEGRYIQQGRNVLILGSTGVGKSHLACALDHQACIHGYRTTYFNVNRELFLFHPNSDLNYAIKVLERRKKEIEVKNDLLSIMAPLDAATSNEIIESLKRIYSLIYLIKV